MRSEIAHKISLDHVRYSQVWEDHSLLEEGLLIDAEDDVLSITSAGDNALAMLLEEPKSVTAIDMNATQNALLALKVAAIHAFEAHADFIAFLGFAAHENRVECYLDQVRPHLEESARFYWDEQPDLIARGVAHTGRLERYIASWRAERRPEIWSDDLLDRLFAEQPLEQQRELYLNEARTPAFIESLLHYFGKEMLATGRSSAQLEHVSLERTGEVFLSRFDRACTTLSIARNPYLWMLLRGEIGPLEHATPYLRPENYQRLRSGLLDRLRWKTIELEVLLTEAPEGTYSKVNLSDVFEYMSAEHSDALFQVLADRLRRGGRIAYWNLLVERSRPAHLADRILQHTDLAHALLKKDRAWFYGAFNIEEMI